jgi:hypothetical protein
MIRNMQTVYPLPEKWEGDEKAFGIRLEGALKQLQLPALVRNYTYQYTVANGATKAISKSDFGIPTDYQQYYPVAITSFHGGSENVRVIAVQPNSDNYTMVVRNESGSSVTATARLSVLYMLNERVK